ncbi:transcription factor protein isoform X2 [Ciona intestinalis]
MPVSLGQSVTTSPSVKSTSLLNQQHPGIATDFINMATAASGELNGFHHLHHHHHPSEQYYRHEHYHHHFHHPNFDGYPNYNDRDTPIAGEMHKNNLHNFASKSMGLEGDKLDENCNKSPNYLPPIGDALLRRDNRSDASKNNAKEEDESGCSKFVMQESDNSLTELQKSSAVSEHEKKEEVQLKTNDAPEDFSVKTEQSELYQFHARNFSIFTPSSQRGTPDEGMNLIPVETTDHTSIDSYFRSDAANANPNSNPIDSVPSSVDGPSYATLTPLQPLPSISSVSDKYIPTNETSYATLTNQELTDCSSYSKMGGMGHSLPPLSNRMILNGLAAQTRGGMQSQAAIDAVNQAAAAAVGLSHYNKPVLSSNIIPPPPPVSNPYDPHVFGRIDQCNDMGAGFPGGHMFPHRSTGFVSQYGLQDLSSSLQVSAPSERRRPTHEDIPADNGKRHSGSDRLGGSGLQPHSSNSASSSRTQQIEEVNTKEVASKITQELKRYSIPQAIFAQRVLCRSQGTLSDLLRNPKPWSKLKSGRETFRRMWKWLQEPEFQRMSSLRLAACKRKEDEKSYENSVNSPKKPRLVFTDLQRRTLHAIFKESKRPSKEMQIQISQQLGLEVTTVSNFFMNARRRSLDKWQDDESGYNSKENSRSNNPSSDHHLSASPNHQQQQQQQQQHQQQQQQAYQQHTQDTRLSYAPGESLLSPLCGSPSGHLHFPPPHHLHHHNLHQQQQNTMLSASHLTSSGLVHPYQSQHQLLGSDVTGLVNPR